MQKQEKEIQKNNGVKEHMENLEKKAFSFQWHRHILFWGCWILEMLAGEKEEADF